MMYQASSYTRNYLKHIIYTYIWYNFNVNKIVNITEPEKNLLKFDNTLASKIRYLFEGINKTQKKEKEKQLL